jgi:ubiquinone/menaquinone biosynthesis C-methylase UbiE
MATQPTAQPNPVAIFDELQAYQRTVALKGALDLNLFTLIDEGATTPAQLATRTGASERGLRVLCDFMTIRNFLSKQDGSYALTANAKLFLSQKSPAYLGAMANFLAHPMTRANFDDIAAVVRKGGTVGQHNALEPEHPIWEEFARSMAGMASMFAVEAVERVREMIPGGPAKILDLAAGHGMYGLSFAKAFPNAKVVGQDWDNVLNVARENARKLGVEDRYSTIPGSAWEADLGTGYDLILEPNLAHHFDMPTNVALFKRLRPALKPGALLAILDFVPNEDRVTPHAAGAFALTMLAATPQGDAYTLAEYTKMLTEAGFKSIELHSFQRSPQRMITAVA